MIDCVIHQLWFASVTDGEDAFNELPERAVALWAQSRHKATIAAIKRDLALEGIIATHKTVGNTISRWCATGSVCDRPRSGRSDEMNR